ncbi:MAG: TM2 domain-containing protein [Colwellia sp.]
MNDEALKIEENQLREKISQLTDKQKKHYYSLEVKQVKDPDTYAALNWACLAGLHHFYLGKWLRGAINLAVMVFALLLWFTGISSRLGAMLLCFVFIVEIPQLINSQKIIYQYNVALMRKLLRYVIGQTYRENSQ